MTRSPFDRLRTSGDDSPYFGPPGPSTFGVSSRLPHSAQDAS
jgi:hypothetical protein